MKIKTLQSILMLAFALLFWTGSAAAQSTIFSMPSTDVLDKGKVGVSLIARFKTNDDEAKKKFSSFIPRVFVGIGKNVEIGANLYGNVQPGADSTTFVPTVKWRFYEHEKYKIAAVGGSNFYIPLRNKKYNFGSYTYLQMSKSFSTGTKITAGSYVFTKNVVAKNASRGGGQFGFEQRINKTFGFAAEWLTGKHSSGNLTAGFKVKFNKKAVGSFGYTVFNDKAMKGNHYFYTSITLKF